LNDSPALVWFRDDLRLDDQPAVAAVGRRPALFVFVFDEESSGLRRLGGASKWWLAHSLAALAASVAAIGGRLDILRGEAGRIVPALAAACGASEVYWTRRYGGPEVALDNAIEATLVKNGVKALSFNGQLLREPWEVVNGSGHAFRVFTPFWKRLRGLGPFHAPTRAPIRLDSVAWPKDGPKRVKLEELGLTPTRPDWSGGLAETWRPGEAGAKERLRRFLDDALAAYPKARDDLAGETTSRLSPHLRFGEISARRVAAAIENALADGAPTAACEKYLSELAWREFSYSLLYNFPDLAKKNWNAGFDSFPYLNDKNALNAWSNGETGYPIVDAGMRELWHTGYMHNRVRMIAASFLIKHLLCNWRRGEGWFWDTLCDADPANNPASWQWVAGSGADAAPYFRIFNPVLQGRKFDPEGAYVRRWAPELAKISHAHIHAPWLAPADELRAAGVTLGRDYPEPIVDHAFARKRALAAYQATRE
jgi:deoxyribodipyrimidine photo-lyase